MKNGSNDWGVTYGRISWLEDAVRSHENVISLRRYDDIVMDVERDRGRGFILICLDEYTLGESAVRRVMREFPLVNFIYVGGNWNGYTPEAKELCLSRKIGVYNAGELTGAIFKDEFWAYHKKDKDGNPLYPYKK